MSAKHKAAELVVGQGPPKKALSSTGVANYWRPRGGMRKYQTVEKIEVPADVLVQQRRAPIAGNLCAYLQSANQDQHKGLEGESEDTESSITVLSQQSLLSLDAARLVV